MSKELAPICPGGQHEFIQVEDTAVAGCGAGSGDQNFMELIVFYSPAPKSYQPKPGDYCSKCFQVFGQPEGIRNSQFVEYHRLLNSYEEQPK